MPQNSVFTDAELGIPSRTTASSSYQSRVSTDQTRGINSCPFRQQTSLSGSDMELGVMPNTTAPPSYKSRNSTDQSIGLNWSHFYRQAREPGPLQQQDTNTKKDDYKPSEALTIVLLLLDAAVVFFSFMAIIFAGCMNERYKKYRNRALEGVRTWPDKLDTTEIKCLIGLSIASFSQAIFTFLFVFALDSVSCMLILLVIFSIFVTAYSAVVPYLFGFDTFKTGAYSSDINLHSTLLDWTCEMEFQLGSERIPFDDFCQDSRGGRVLLAIVYSVYFLSWFILLCAVICRFRRYLNRRWC